MVLIIIFILIDSVDLITAWILLKKVYNYERNRLYSSCIQDVQFEGIYIIKWLCIICLLFEIFLTLMFIFDYELFTVFYITIQPFLLPIIIFECTQILIGLLHLFQVLIYIRYLNQRVKNIPLRSDMMPSNTAIKLNDYVYNKMVEGII